MKTFLKNWSIVSELKVLQFHFYKKLPCQKPMLRQIEWEVQNGPIRKNGYFVTDLSFGKFNFIIRTSCK